MRFGRRWIKIRRNYLNRVNFLIGGNFSNISNKIWKLDGPCFFNVFYSALLVHSPEEVWQWERRDWKSGRTSFSNVPGRPTSALKCPRLFFWMLCMSKWFHEPPHHGRFEDTLSDIHGESDAESWPWSRTPCTVKQCQTMSDTKYESCISASL